MWKNEELFLRPSEVSHSKAFPRISAGEMRGVGVHWSGVGVVVLNHSRGQATRLWGAQGNMAGSGRNFTPFWAGVKRSLWTWRQVLGGKGGAAAPTGIWKEDHIRTLFLQGSGKYTQKFAFSLGEHLLSFMDLCASIHTGKCGSVLHVSTFSTHMQNTGNIFCTVLL